MLQLPLPSIWSLFVLNMYLLYTPYFHVIADSNSVSCTRVCTCTYTCLCTDALVDVWQNGWLKSNWHSPWLLELVAIIVELMWNVTYMYIYLLYTYNMCTCMYLWGCWYWCITTVHYAYCTVLVSPSLLRHLMCVVGCPRAYITWFGLLLHVDDCI